MATSSAMSDKRRLLAEMAARGDTRGGSAGRTGRRIAAAVAVIAVVACGWWWMSRGPATPPEVLEVRSIVDAKIAELAQVERNEIPLPSDSGIGAVFDKMRDMPQDVRGQAGREIGRLFEARERAEVRSYFALPPAERPKELARRVAADEARRKAREAERASRGGPGGPGQQAAAGDRGGSRGGPPGGGPGGGPGGPGGPGGVAGRSSSEEARNDRRKQGIDRSTPEDRAQRSEYRRAYDALRRAGRS